MATLPTLYPTSDAQVGTWRGPAGQTTNLYTYCNEGIAAAVETASIIFGPDGAASSGTNDYIAQLTDMPSDFSAMTALSYQVRYANTTRTDDTVGFTFVIESSAGTAYTNVVTFANLNSTSYQNSAVTAFTLTAAGLAASKTDWDAARWRFTQTYTVSMSNDNSEVGISAMELTGTYTATGPAASSPPPNRFRNRLHLIGR